MTIPCWPPLADRLGQLAETFHLSWFSVKWNVNFGGGGVNPTGTL